MAATFQKVTANTPRVIKARATLRLPMLAANVRRSRASTRKNTTSSAASPMKKFCGESHNSAARPNSRIPTLSEAQVSRARLTGAVSTGFTMCRI